jgi:hypothetical protein
MAKPVKSDPNNPNTAEFKCCSAKKK